jgi:hypothetical protein
LKASLAEHLVDLSGVLFRPLAITLVVFERDLIQQLAWS